MDKSKFSLLKVVALLFLAVFIFLSGRLVALFDPARTTELEQLKKEVSQGLYRDLDKMVAARVKVEFARLARQSGVPANFDQLSMSSQNLPKVSRHDVVRSMIDKLISEEMAKDGLTDDKLDQITAGAAVEPNVKTAGGFTKNPAASKAKVPVKKAVKKKAADDKQVAEEVNSRPDSIERTLQQRGSVLLPKGTWLVEPGMTYAHFSSNRLNVDGLYVLPLLIGEVSTQSVNRDVFIETLGLKYGLLNNFQVDMKVPFRQEYDRIINNTSSTAISRNGAAGLGDVEMGMSRQIGWEHGMMPDLIASLSVKTPSGQQPYNHDVGLGTGHWAVRGALIAAKSSDPAVIFGSVNYAYNFARNNIENFGDVKPGDSIGYSMGVAIALSYQTAVSFSFDQSVNFPTMRNGQTAADSFLNSADLKVGLNWAVSEKQSVNLAVSEGLTKDSPDMSVELSFPHQF